MALPNKPKGELAAVVNPEIVEHDVDILIVGGGMAACGAAFEIKKWAPADMKITLVDKAALERSGAVAQGLSAINTYIGENPIESYVKMVRNDLMGVVREDLIYDLGRHVDESVKLFEEWGLPIWKRAEDGSNLDGHILSCGRSSGRCGAGGSGAGSTTTGSQAQCSGTHASRFQEIATRNAFHSVSSIIKIPFKTTTGTNRFCPRGSCDLLTSI